MHTINPKVDNYMVNGCGRCKLYATPQCKVNFWREELEMLRQFLLESELTEDLKWGSPCYTLNGKNVILIGTFKEYVMFSFLKGVLLNDPKSLLVLPGENSQSAKVMRFTNKKEITKHKAAIKDFIKQSIELEKTGKKVALKKIDEYAIPEELEAIFKKNVAFKNAFTELTPGRQRGYLMHFAQAKQAETRIARIEKYMPQILQGKGIMDDYKMKK